MGTVRSLFSAAMDAPVVRNLKANQSVKDAYEGLGVASGNLSAASKMQSNIARGDMSKVHEMLAERQTRYTELASSKPKKAERFLEETGTMKEMLEASGFAKRTDNLTTDEIRQARKNMADIKGGYQKRSDAAVKEMGRRTKDYFWDDDLGVRATRIGAGVAAYGAAAVGTRALTGGSATHNNQGKRDVAGIPFV